MEARNNFHTLEELYISPFTRARRFDDNGQPYYVAITRDLNPTGIYAADVLLRSFSEGRLSLADVAGRLGCDGRDLSGLLRCLTGMPSEKFRIAYRKRIVSELLRYTSLPISEVATRSGVGSARNLSLFCNNHFRSTPVELRRRLRQQGDEGRFAVG